MKLGLLCLLMVCLAGLCYAQSAADQDSPNRASPKQDSSKQGSPKPKPAAQDSDFLASPVAHGAADRLILGMTDSFLPDSSGSSCAYMRTYRVKRQQRGSDAVAPAGYTTCVPTRHFDVKSAVQTQTDAGDDTREDSGARK